MQFHKTSQAENRLGLAIWAGRREEGCSDGSGWVRWGEGGGRLPRNNVSLTQLADCCLCSHGSGMTHGGFRGDKTSTFVRFTSSRFKCTRRKKEQQRKETWWGKRFIQTLLFFPHHSFCNVSSVWLYVAWQKCEVIIETYGWLGPLLTLSLMMLGYYRRTGEGHFYH